MFCQQWTNTTAPELLYSSDQRQVEIIGVALEHDKPPRHARVEVVVTLGLACDSTDLFRRVTQTDQKGVYRMTCIEPNSMAETARVREIWVESSR